MHYHKKNKFFTHLYSYIYYFLIVIFWITLIFAFDDLYTASCTVIAALVHELGHKMAFKALGSHSSLPVPNLGGFKIKSELNRSYVSDIICAISGPLANLLLCVLSLPLIIANKDAYKIFAVVNIATALSNLLPVRGYDGYKLLSSLLSLTLRKRTFINIIEVFSFSTVCLLTFLSLYLIKNFGEGYWVFGIFFFLTISEIKKSVVTKNEE